MTQHQPQAQAIEGASLGALDQLALDSLPEFFSEAFVEPQADQKRSALRELACAMGMDDLEDAKKAEARLCALGISDKERADVSHFLVDRSSGCSGEIAVWFAQTPWLAARDAAMKSGRGFCYEKDGRTQWLWRLAGDANREAFDALIKAQLMSLDEALELSAAYSKPAMALRYAARVMAQGRAPAPEALSALCRHAAAMESHLPARLSAHPLLPFLTVWADAIEQKERSHMWVSAVNCESPSLVSAMARAGLSLDDWRLTPDHRYSYQEEKDPAAGPRLLDFAISLSRNPGVAESKALQALWLIEPVIARLDEVDPRAMRELSNAELEHLVKKGVNIYNVDEQGNNFLHHAFKHAYASPSASYLVASAKRFPAAWGRENNEGKSPLELIKNKDVAESVRKALSQGEEKELRKELKGRRGSKVAKGARSL